MQSSKVYSADSFLDFFWHVIYSNLVNPETVSYFKICLGTSLK